MDLFQILQKNVFDYCENLSDSSFILLVNIFNFEPLDETEISNKIRKDFLVALELESIYSKHLIDLTSEAYFLKCHGSALRMIEDIKIALLVCSYNKLKNHVRNTNKKRRGKKTNSL